MAGVSTCLPITDCIAIALVTRINSLLVSLYL